MTAELRYVYGLTFSDAAPRINGADVRGIEDRPVATLVQGDLLAVASGVPADEYDEVPLNAHLQDLDWLAPRAAAHQAVNAKLLELAEGVLPLSFGTIYRDDEGIRRMIAADESELLERLRGLVDRAEWIVTVDRGDDAAADSPALRALEKQIASASPGRSFLLGKRRAEVVRSEQRVADVTIADGVAAELSAVAERVYREPLIEDASATAVARLSVLIRRSDERSLTNAARRLGEQWATRGYRVRLSGPWPAYRFGGLPPDRVTA